MRAPCGENVTIRTNMITIEELDALSRERLATHYALETARLSLAGEEVVREIALSLHRRTSITIAASEKEEEALNLDKKFVNIKWEVVPDRYLDTQSKYNNTLLSVGSLEFQNNVTVLSRKLITRKIKTKSLWKRRRLSSSKLRLRASSTEWYPVYHARTPSPTNPEVFFGE